jgi:hypothetical protein
MDFSKATDDELVAEMEGMELALKATLGQPFDGREEGKNAYLLSQIEAIKAELDRRNANRP